MLNIPPPDFNFCPMCGTGLSTRQSEGKDQKFCASCKWVYYPHVVSSVGAIIVKDNQVLMVRRKIEPYKGSWMFPSGFVSFGEHPQETVIREVKEETGLEARDVDLITVEQAVDDTREPGHFYYVFKVTVDEGNLSTDLSENTDIKWISLQDTPDIGWPIHKKYFKKLKDKEI